MKKNISNMSKKSKMIAATAFVLGLTLMGAGAARAATIDPSTIHQNPMSDVVSAIATKFNLAPADVQAIVDQVMAQKRSAMEATMQQKLSDKLAAAVTAGTITQAQADLITAKMADMKAQMDANKAKFATMTPAERKAEMKTQMDAMKQWMTDNKIPAGVMPFGGFKGFGGHMGHRGMMGGMMGSDGANK